MYVLCTQEAHRLLVFSLSRSYWLGEVTPLAMQFSSEGGEFCLYGGAGEYGDHQNPRASLNLTMEQPSAR